jgi:hypothetical protein
MVLIDIPEHLGVFQTRAESAKCLVCSGLEVATLALDLVPKYGGNCPSLPPPGQ